MIPDSWNMTDTSARLLALLSLLQSRPRWSGRELSERLGVTGRTIRTDIGRLRALGYPVDAERGSTGSYRLGAGGTLPPLLLDDDEAVAVVVALQFAQGLAEMEETSARTLAKLEQVLPSRLRPTVAAIRSAVTSGPVTDGTSEGVPVAPGVLAAISAAIRDREWLRFEESGEPRVVEPYRLVSWQRHWHLVARDARSGDWQTFRVDRIALRAPTRRRFAPRGLEPEEYTAILVRDVASSGWSVHARITVLASAETVLARINPAVGVVEPIDEGRCVLVTGADSLEIIAVYIGMLGLDFRVDSPPALVDRVRELGGRYARAVD